VTIFRRLLSLYPETVPLEDYFTEIIAHLFSIQPELFLSWFEQLGILDQQSLVDIRIVTQHSMDALEHHEFSSRFDLLIELDDGIQVDWVVIESKLGSTEGPNQLRRYAEHLANNSAIRHGILVFITRDYEPKNREIILDNLPLNRVIFVQLRWNDFYHFLRRQQSSAFIKEVLGFMKELQMNHSNQFTATDIVALSGLKKVYGLMQATLNEEVKSRFKEITGINPLLTDVNQLQNNRYFLWAWPTPDWWIGIGFSFASDEGNEYPTVRLQLEVSTRAKPMSRHQIIEAMRAIANRAEWRSYNLSTTRAWSGVLREHSLRTVLGSDDHVIGTRKICLALLEEVREIKQQFLYLPWTANTARTGVSEETE